MIEQVILGEWMPDRPPLGLGPNLITADDVYPVAGGYRCFPNLSDSLSAGSLNATCCGAAAGRRRNDGTGYTAAATASKLYVTTTAGALADRTPGTWSLGATSTAEFAQYGDRLLACAIEHIIQTHTLSGTSAFADLSADAPKARHLAVIGEHVMAGNIVGQGANASAIGTARDAVQWCFFRNPASWPVVGTDAAKAGLSDYRILPGFGGDVTGVVGGRDYGVVFQQRQVSLAVLDPGGAFFRFQPVDDKRGAMIPGSIVSAGSVRVFYSEEGWMRMDGASAPVPIGFGRVDETFKADFRDSYAHRVSAAAHPSLPIVCIAYPGVGAASGAPNRILVYNILLDRWSMVNVPVEWLVSSSQVGPNVDTPISADIDGTPFDVDAASYEGTRSTLSAFAPTTHKLQVFSGSARSGRIQTGDFEITPGRTTFVRGVRPIQSGVGSTVVSVYGRNTPASAPQFRGYAAPNDSMAVAGTRSRARYHRADMIALTDNGVLSGFDADVSPMGMR